MSSYYTTNSYAPSYLSRSILRYHEARFSAMLELEHRATTDSRLGSRPDRSVSTVNDESSHRESHNA